MKLINLNKKIWKGELVIPIKSSDINVGIFSILGEKKEYFSNNPNNGTPEFHSPELFLRL